MLKLATYGRRRALDTTLADRHSSLAYLLNVYYLTKCIGTLFSLVQGILNTTLLQTALLSLSQDGSSSSSVSTLSFSSKLDSSPSPLNVLRFTLSADRFFVNLQVPTQNSLQSISSKRLQQHKVYITLVRWQVIRKYFTKPKLWTQFCLTRSISTCCNVRLTHLDRCLSNWFLIIDTMASYTSH